jgi:hypothetical protein
MREIRLQPGEVFTLADGTKIVAVAAPSVDAPPPLEFVEVVREISKELAGVRRAHRVACA